MKNIKFIYIIIIVFSGLNIYLYSIKHEDTPDNYLFWASLNLWLHVIPLLHYLYDGYKKDIFPFMGLVGIFLMLSFSLPVFFIRPYNYQLGVLNVNALQWAFWGYLSFYFFYFIIRNNNIFITKHFGPIKLNLYNPKIRHVAILFLIINFSSKYMIDNTAMTHLGNLGIFIYIGTYLLLLNNKVPISTIERFMFYIVFVNEYLTRLFDGLLALAAVFTIYIAIIDFYSKRKIIRSFVIIIPFILVFLIISPIKSDFREIVWFSEREQGYSTIDRLGVIAELTSERGTRQDIVLNSRDDDRENFFWRYSYQASALSLVLEMTPNNVPYWNGESYKIFSKFIPRFLWPDKPKESMGYDFGTRYGIIDVSNTGTSMNTPILTEMYINFGYTGIIIGMFLLAIVYVLLNNYFNSLEISDIGRVYSIAIIFPLMVHESNFTLQFGNVPLMIIAVYGIARTYLSK